MDGGPGNDLIDGYYGNDHLEGNDGNDDVSGYVGIDSIAGGIGSDRLFGGTNQDRISGSYWFGALRDFAPDFMDCGANSGTERDTAVGRPSDGDYAINCEIMGVYE